MAPLDVISVVIPAFDAARYLGDAIRSVLAQHRPLEVLVIDDGSTDGTPVVAQSFGPPVVCRSRPRGGAASARNAGVDLARGELIAFLDADDLWTPTKLERQCSALDADRELEAVFGHVQQFIDPLDGSEGQLGPVVPGYLPSAMLIRASALRRVGPFDQSLPRADAVEWYVRARARQLRHVMLPDVVLHRRIHDRNLGIREREVQTGEYFRVLRAELQRQRQSRDKQ